MVVTELSVLRQKSEPCNEKDAQDIIEKLRAEIKNYPHAGGLAAIQIGIPKRVAIILSKGNFIELVNPVIIDQYDDFCSSEGCLSLPGTSVLVRRYQHVVAKDARSENSFIYCQPESVFLQHEIDHMDGILITDKQVQIKATSYGRNDPCPECGKKLKKCPHGDKYLSTTIKELAR